MVILIFVAAVLVLDVLAFFLGEDSRKTLFEQCKSLASHAQI